MKLLEGVKQPGGMLKPWLSYIRTHIKEATFSIHLIIPPLDFLCHFLAFPFRISAQCLPLFAH
jgi:hypothetical protein